MGRSGPRGPRVASNHAVAQNAPLVRTCAMLLAALYSLPAYAQSGGQVTPVDGPQFYALVDVERFELHAPDAVVRGVHQGQHRFLLRSNALYRLYKLDAQSLRVGVIEFRSGRDGQRVQIPPVPLRPETLAHLDEDGDGLSTIGEWIVGTDPRNPSTGNDGVLDGERVRTGTLDLPLLRTGVIASVRLPGLAHDVCSVNEAVAVALDSAGVVLANVFTRMNPEVVALVDTPGLARRVAATGTLLAVADGFAGLAVIDVSDPPAARIVHQISGFLLVGDATCVAAIAGVALVGLSTGDLVTVDLSSGTILERVRVSTRPLRDVVVGGDAIYVLDTSTLHALPLTLGQLSVASSVPSPFFAGPNDRLFVGGGVAYAVHGKGVNTFSLAQPLQPQSIAVSDTTQFGWKHLVLNGSGLALAAVSPNSTFDGPHNVSLYDASDPAQTNLVLSEIETPGVARALTIANGLLYVADHAAGLQVVNYQPQDRAGIAPTVTLTTNQPVATHCEEGAILRISAACLDDVAVRNAELYVDGVLRETRASYPFDFFLVAPRLSERERISVRVRVSDTGGNVTLSDELVITLTPDTSAPHVVRVVPPADGLIGRAGAIAAFFDEPIDPESLTGLRLTWAGPDRAFETEDDQEITGSREFQPVVRGAFLRAAAGDLAAGRYRAQVTSEVRDAAGNQAVPITWEFTVYGAGVDSDGDGLPDELEIILGYNPENPSSLGDGISDGDRDFTGGGVPNWIKVALGWDLRSTDSDGNGIADVNEDRDADRLKDWQEVLAATNPFSRDTDEDGFEDKDELDHDSDPLSAQSIPLRFAASVVGLRNDTAPPFNTAASTTSVRNDAPPDAVNGSTEGPSFSLENQDSP